MVRVSAFLFIFFFRVTETNIAHKTSEQEKLQKIRKDFIKRPPKKILTFKENIKEEEEEVEETDERKRKTKANIPPPYDQYYDYEWFPKSVGFNTSTIVHALLSQMNPDEPMIFKDILACFVDIHRVCGIYGSCFDKIVEALFPLIDHSSAQIRHFTVKVLCALGVNRKKVVLKLVSKLDDPVSVVREEVKIAIDKMAGITNADTLVSSLRQYGALIEEQRSDDREVLEQFRETITARKDSLRERLTAFYANYAERDARITHWLNEMNRPNPAKKVRKRFSKSSAEASFNIHENQKAKRKTQPGGKSSHEEEIKLSVYGGSSSLVNIESSQNQQKDDIADEINYNDTTQVNAFALETGDIVDVSSPTQHSDGGSDSLTKERKRDAIYTNENIEHVMPSNDNENERMKFQLYSKATIPPAGTNAAFKIPTTTNKVDPSSTNTAEVDLQFAAKMYGSTKYYNEHPDKAMRTRLSEDISSISHQTSLTSGQNYGEKELRDEKSLPCDWRTYLNMILHRYKSSTEVNISSFKFILLHKNC
ncbi:uncharacterized protein LOC130653813 [Hydractinia symbiolongicarpus]|uniref:uncharacterized protein LOC130653813 n=1 Tax=Hydractinia symbiolongicarpus TaxID=13093 RepID=UPI002550C10B|nr:uncharacterized protein LOC130653813 [Hydractinia symbiolongicarpus]